ncbi:MAG: hypothetical protein AB1295_02835 [Candidatus Micrarchaeota archaeon]
MKKLLFGKNLGETGGKREQPETKRRPVRTIIASAVLAGFLGCGGGNNHDSDAGNQNDAQVCTTPGIGSEHMGPSEENTMPALGITQRVTIYLTPVDCVDHLSAEETAFVPVISSDDLIKGRLAIHRNAVTVLGNQYDLFVYRDFDGARLQTHDVDSFEVDKIFNIPSPEGDIVWQVQAINQTTETVAGRTVTKAIFQVLNSPDRTPEQTQKTVYLVTDPADYVAVYDAVAPTGAMVNYFSLPARTGSNGIEFVKGKVWAEPSTSALSVAVETSSFDVEPCESDCGTLPYGSTGRNVTLDGIGVVYGANGMTGFTFTTGFFPLE